MLVWIGLVVPILSLSSASSWAASDPSRTGSSVYPGDDVVLPEISQALQNTNTPDEEARAVERLSPQARQALLDAAIFTANQDEIIQGAFRLRTALANKLEEVIARRGQQTFLSLLLSGKDKHEFRLEDPQYGYVEASTIDSLLIFRVVHQASGVAILMVPNTVTLESDHLAKYIGRQHFDANDFKGRHVIVLRMHLASRKECKDGETLSEDCIPQEVMDHKVSADMSREERERITLSHVQSTLATVGDHHVDRLDVERVPSLWREPRRYLKSFMDATYVSPQKGDYLLATYCSVIQGAIMCGLSGAQMLMDPVHHSHFAYKPAALSALWAFVIGAHSGSWKNFTNRGHFWTRFAKNAANSIVFAYTLEIWTRAGNAAKPMSHLYQFVDPHGFLGLLSVAALALHGHILANVVVNNITRDFWSVFSRIWEKTGVGRGQTVHVGGYDTEIQKTRFNSQNLGLVSFGLKMADLVHFSISLPVMGNVPLGKMLYWSSVWWVQKLSVLYAERTRTTDGSRLALDEAEVRAMQQKWAKWNLFNPIAFVRAWRDEISRRFRGQDAPTAAACNAALQEGSRTSTVPLSTVPSIPNSISTDSSSGKGNSG